MSNGTGNAAGCEAAVAAPGDTTDLPERAETTALTINSVARMFKIPVFTLRYYELRGLVRRHWSGGERIYSWSQCERIALIVKARRAGLALRDLQPVLVAMDEQAARSVAESGRLQCLSLINILEDQQQAVGNVLGELYRIDWELSARLGVKDSGGTGI